MGGGGLDTSTSLHVPAGQQQTLWGRPRGPAASFVGAGMAGGSGAALPHFWPFPGSCTALSPRGAACQGTARPAALGVCPTGTLALGPQRCLVAPPRASPAPAGCARVRPPRSGTAVHGGICCSRRGRWAASELSVCGGGCHRNPFPPERGGGRGRRLLAGRASGERAGGRGAGITQAPVWGEARGAGPGKGLGEASPSPVGDAEPGRPSSGQEPPCHAVWVALGESLPSQGLGPEGASLDRPQGASAGGGRPGEQMPAICGEGGLLPARSPAPSRHVGRAPAMRSRGWGSQRGQGSAVCRAGSLRSPRSQPRWASAGTPQRGHEGRPLGRVWPREETQSPAPGRVGKPART